MTNDIKNFFHKFSSQKSEKFIKIEPQSEDGKPAQLIVISRTKHKIYYIFIMHVCIIHDEERTKGTNNDWPECG